jgi:maltooligosyltrehalose trehalohydrolase
MGATPTADGVRFRVWAPAASSVDVEFDGRRRPLEAEGNGAWSGLIRDVRTGTRYRYVLNGELCRPDPYSRYQPEGPHGPSEVVDPDAFAWRDSDWRGLPIQGLVIYQTHVGTATPAGTLDALIDDLPRLNALGVNAVQLLPLAEFPGTRNWGYDGVDLFAVSRNYGGPPALKRFIDAAHAQDLAVIVDVVYNHFGPDGNYVRDFSPAYFTDRHHTPWGDAINFDGPGSEWVRKFVVDNALFWLHEYHADGLRLDATHAIVDESPAHILAELAQAARTSVGAEHPVVLIAETGENDVHYLKPVEEGGFGMDAVYADDFHHSLRRYLAGDDEGYYADYAGTLDEVARCIQQGWLYEGQPAPRSHKPRGTSARDRPAWQFLYVIQNHDQVGNRAFGERLHQQIGIERFAAASALLLFLPFTPMLLMGQEFGASTPFQFFTDHNAELGRLVTEGRRREFKAFSAFADPASRERIPDPQAELTFLNSKLRLNEAASPPGCDLQAWYQSLLRLRRSDPVLKDQSREHLTARALGKDVLAVRRWLPDGDERLLLVNFGDAPFETDEFGDGWRVLLGRAVGLSVPRQSAAILARGPA